MCSASHQQVTQSLCTPIVLALYEISPVIFLYTLIVPALYMAVASLYVTRLHTNLFLSLF